MLSEQSLCLYRLRKGLVAWPSVGRFNCEGARYRINLPRERRMKISHPHYDVEEYGSRRREHLGVP